MHATHAVHSVPKAKRQDAPPGAAQIAVPPSRLAARTGACACGGTCPRCSHGAGRSRAIAIGEPDDAYELEADRVANRIMSAPHANGMPGTGAPTSSPPRVSRYTAQPASATSRDAPAIVHDTLRAPGEPLDAATRAFFEPRFGRDLSGVRVHADARAALSARAVQAHAYTVGSHIVFGSGRWAPHLAGGRTLLAHELTHTLQQSDGAAGDGPRIGASPVLQGQFEAPKPPPDPTACMVDPFTIGRALAGDREAMLKVVSCCIDFPVMGKG